MINLTGGNNRTFVAAGPFGDERWTECTSMGLSSPLAPPLTLMALLLLLSLGIQGEIPQTDEPAVFYLFEDVPSGAALVLAERAFVQAAARLESN